MKQEALDLFIDDIVNESLIRNENKIDFHDFYKYRVSFIREKDTNLIFLFVASLTNKIERLKKELIRCKDDFLDIFGDILQHRFDAKTFEVFDPTVDSIHRNLSPKISLVGFSGVGKTTITRLIKADEIPMQHIPTITGDIATIKIGKLQFHLWDFAGQEQFRYLWNSFIKGSDAVLLITDSTIENVERSKIFLEVIKENASHAQSAVISNKQDLKDAMNPLQIEKILGLKAYSMIAKDPNNRNKMIQIIADVLEINAEVSPLLKPLLDREKLIEEAVKALKDADFNKSAFLFDKISDLSIELGDDSLGKEFFDKSQKIKDMLKRIGAPPPTPAKPTIEKELKRTSPFSIKKQLPETPKIFNTTDALKTSNSKPIPPKLPPTKITHELPIKQKLVNETKTEKIGQKELINLPIVQENIGLKLNPDDFFVKIKTKSMEDSPKDAKYQLTASSFSKIKNSNDHSISAPLRHVKQKQENGKINDTKSKNIPKIDSNSLRSEVLKKAVDLSKSSPILKKDLKKSLIELKLKKANLSKTSIDFEMKELKGEITAVELQEKKEEINDLQKQINTQIEELQKLIND